MFSENRTRARTKYREFMAEKDGYERNEVYAIIDQRIKGDDQFVDRVLEQHDSEAKMTRQKKIPLEDIAKAVEDRYGVSLNDLRSASRTQTLARARKVLSVIAREKGYKAKEIAGYLQKDPTLVSIYFRDAGDLASDVKAMGKVVKNNSSFQA
jgi:chromosomal replication initiation ATPase DnaA